jgi:glycosyltransferase involved in cell wall biosynthesis
MPKLIVAALVKNEASKYWKSALSAWSEFADAIVVLDDNSSDETAEIAWECEKATVFGRYGEKDAWGAEAAARQQLWEHANEVAEVGDYIFVLDADMVPAGDPRELTELGADTVYFALYDLWGRDERERLLYRDDAFWCAHNRPRAWMVRKPRDFKADWPTRGIHCGHLPSNWEPKAPLFAPPSHSLLHFAYADEVDRLVKAAQYLDLGDKLLPSEASHAYSILDAKPRLKPLLKKPRWQLERAK